VVQKFGIFSTRILARAEQYNFSVIPHHVESRLFSRKTRSRVTFHYRTSELYNHDHRSHWPEKRDSERRFSRSLSRHQYTSPLRLGYNSFGQTRRAFATSTTSTGMRSTAVIIVGFWPGVRFLFQGTRLESHRLTAAGIDSCTFLFRPFRILPGVADVTSRPRVPWNAHVSRRHFRSENSPNRNRERKAMMGRRRPELL